MAFASTNVLMVEWVYKSVATVSTFPKGVPIASYLSGGVSGSTSASDPGLFLITTSALGFRACQI